MSSRPRRSIAAVVAVLVVSSLMAIAPASAETEAPRMSHPWISAAENPDAVADALAVHRDKIPAEFRDRLRWTLPDGTLRVMVALQGRDSTVEAFVEDATTWAQWYGDAPRFLARVTQEQLVRLLAAGVVTFVEPDYRITNFMATSTLDVHARSIGADTTGVWTYDPSAGPMGALKSNIPGLSADQATGKGVTVAITDSGIDRTHRDFGGWDCEAGPYQPCESRIVRAVTVDHLVGAGADPGDFLPTTELASGHGTHVAGTVAGNGYYTRDGGPNVARYGADGHNFGIAPQANLISTKNGDTIWAGLSTFGLQWQLDHAEEYGIRVSSNSWGCLGGCSFNGASTIGQLFKDMYEAGIVVVFAAGNDGGNQSGTSFSGNAQSPYVLGVANYDDATHRLNSSSSRGSDNSLPTASTWTPESEPVNGERRPDVGAPGTSIWSAATLTGGAASGLPRANVSDALGGASNGLPPYVQMSGTSMATPHVAGAAALMFSACPAATPLDVMRAVMAGADSTEILKTTGTAKAEPFEVGYGSLEVRRSVDWLLNQQVCGGTGGGSTEPTPTPTPTATPTPTPTPEPTTDPGPATRYYFHSANGVHAVDAAQDAATFDTNEPEFTDPAVATDVPVVGNAAPGPWDPLWTGTVDRSINSLTVDFWAKVPEEEAQTGGVTWAVDLFDGETPVDLPLFESTTDDITAPMHVQHTFTTMLQNGEEVPLSVSPSGPLSIQIRGNFSVNSVGTTIFFDSVDMPSGFSVGGAAPDPTTTPTPTPTATETAPPPPPSGTRGTYPTTPDDPYFNDEPQLFDPQQWAPQKIKAPQAWQEQQATGYSVNVAVLDSGVDLQHEDLQCPGKLLVVPGSDFTGANDGPDDVNGHGTHVAGSIGACTNNGTGIAGVAPDTTIIPIQVLDAEGSGTVEGIADGIKKAADSGAHVINMSLSLGIGVPGSGAVGWLPGFVPEIDAAVEYANSKGVVVVAAAGNESLPLCEYPAIAEDVVCVGATDSRDLKSFYSGFPNKPDNEDTFGAGLVAPGGSGAPFFCDLYEENILSTMPAELDAESCTGIDSYANLNGTSMATPHVAGVAALVYDRLAGVRSPENRAAVVSALTSSAVDLGAPGYDPVFGHGRVDALGAVRAVDPVAPEPTVAATELAFTASSATGAQYSDDATVEALLTSSGAPLADQELVFELTGSTGTRSWSVSTDGSGIASKRIAVNEDPGTYQLMVRYAGRSGAYLPAADMGTFIVDAEDTATDVRIAGKPQGRELAGTVTDGDSAAPVVGAVVDFVVDGGSIGSATTNDNGVATIALPARYRFGSHTYEAVFSGTAHYEGSSARQQT